MNKKSLGVWKKERAVGRKYSKSDVHKHAKAHTLKKYWVGNYMKKGRVMVKGHWVKNPNYKS